MSSSHTSRSEVGMGSKAQEVGLEVLIISYNCLIIAG